MARSWKTLLIYHIMDQAMIRCSKVHLRGRLLDIGCGTKPYKETLQRFLTEYVGLDREQPFNQAAEIDLVGTAYNIPADSASFDSVISTAALEHLEDPEKAIRECNRVLKHGGVAVYTVPFFWHLHAEPWDYYRFTKYGLKYLFEKVGFEVLEVNALSGFWVTFATMFCYYLDRFNRGPLKYVPIIPAVGVTVQGLAYLFERIDKAEQWTWMYEVVARKK